MYWFAWTFAAFAALFVSLAPARGDNPAPAPPVAACHVSLKVDGVPTCTDLSNAQNAAGLVSCKPNECYIRMYRVVSRTPWRIRGDDPPCEPVNQSARDSKNPNYSSCAVLGIDVPKGSKVTRFRVAAADTTHGPEGEGYCGDNAVCRALPWSSFESYRLVTLNDGSQRSSVVFKNWRGDKGRRAAFAVWFTRPPSGTLSAPK